MGGKRSICLDLKTEEGRESAQALAAEADIVIKSFQPNVVDEFDLNYDAVRADNDDVIYCSITEFGGDGPYSGWPAYNPVLQSMSGLMSAVGYPDRPPVRIDASAINDTQFRRLCADIDRNDLASDGRFADAESRWANREELYETLVAAFEEYDRGTLVERLTDAGVPSGPLDEVDDVVADAHVAARDLLTESRNRTTGESVETAGVPFVTADGRPEMHGEPPAVGEHTRVVLAELGTPRSVSTG